MAAVSSVEVEADEEGLRLDRWFKRHYPGLTHGNLEKLLRTGQVRLDGKRAKSNQRIEAGQVVRVPPMDGDTSQPPRPAPKRADLSKDELKELQGWVLYRDDDVIAINKPAGLAVQGGTKTSHHLDAMLDGLRFGSKERPRLVHRLDRDTSGVLLLARSPKAATALAEAFRDKTARKLYWAIVAGVPSPEQGEIDLPLGKVPGQHGERVVARAEGGKRAVTDFRVLDIVAKTAAWVALSPQTGRTHQLRVHMAALGTPILGDGKYGGRAAFIEADGVVSALHLHARALRLPHPRGGVLEVVAPLPRHFEATIKALGFDPAIVRTAEDVRRDLRDAR